MDETWRCARTWNWWLKRENKGVIMSYLWEKVYESINNTLSNMPNRFDNEEGSIIELTFPSWKIVFNINIIAIYKKKKKRLLILTNWFL